MRIEKSKVQSPVQVLLRQQLPLAGHMLYQDFLHQTPAPPLFRPETTISMMPLFIRQIGLSSLAFTL